jgi:hypothetical protein
MGSAYDRDCKEVAMNMQEAVRQQLEFWHGMMQQMVSDLPPGLLSKREEGSTVGPIGAIYAHAVTAEDVFVQERLKGDRSIFFSGGWEARLRITHPGLPPRLTPEWGATAAARLELETFGEYAQQVYAASEAYLAGLTDEDADRVLPAMPGGQAYSAGWLLTNVVAPHVPVHAGEIAALRGLAGLKGLPF